jgi:ABC-type Zn uptake system ZnuABC Zn-binding protein ZnuA
VREVGGDEVEVTSLTKGPQDPHYVEARPSLIKLLNRADLFVEVGLELEAGWAPVVLRSARNSGVLPGGAGRLNAAAAVRPLEIAPPGADRSMGDVHPLGNPHYLLDPLNGLKVAVLVEAKLSALRPHRQPYFAGRLEDFRRRLARALFGEKLAAGDAEARRLLDLLDERGIDGFLEQLGEKKSLLGGLVAELQPYLHSRVVADHNLWPYFARRFGVEVSGYLEPRPGLSPTTAHLAQLVEGMGTAKVKAILASPYFSASHARFVSEKTGVPVVPMAHQTGAREGTESYLSMVEYNVRTLAAALRSSK